MSTETNSALEIIRTQHSAAVCKGLFSINQDHFQKVANIICKAIKERKNIFTIGNGASAAIAQHWACDYTKGCSNVGEGKYFKVRVTSLAVNIPLMTAISNDISYDEVYAYQLERLGNPGDVLITISSSGNSPNVVKAIEAAIKEKMWVVTLTGFDGGASKTMADEYTLGANVHVDCPEYEAAEDCHQAIMHMLAKYIRKTMWV